MRLGVRFIFVVADKAETIPLLKTASRALYFKVDGVGHQAIQWAIFDNQRSKNFIRNARLRLTYKPVIQGFMSPMDR